MWTRILITIYTRMLLKFIITNYVYLDHKSFMLDLLC